jgi:hypothetical protein
MDQLHLASCMQAAFYVQREGLAWLDDTSPAEGDVTVR